MSTLSRLVALDEIMVLADTIGRAPVPVKADALLRGHDFEELADLGAEDVPALLQVVVERLGLVLGEHDDLVDLGVDAIAQGKVDEAVDPAKRDRRFAAVLGERHEPFTPSAGHDKSQRVSHDILASKSRFFHDKCKGRKGQEPL
jgi:hypothetical protein